MLSDRKNQHLDIVLSGRARGVAATGFDEIAFEHVALPELDLDGIDLSTDLLGKTIRAPFLVSSMTGGPDRAASINQALARACEEAGIAMAVGSQRIAIEKGEMAGIDPGLRRLAPTIPLFANLGAAQLRHGFGLGEACRVVEMIGADALILHFNPLQEAVQAEGDRDWTGILRAAERLARRLPVPLIAKEVGAGFSAAVARRLVEAGFAVIDVAGAGGTSWAAVEAERAPDAARREVARAFVGWGEPTAMAVRAVRAACPETLLIASGGVRDGVDAAKALRLGADVVGLAAGFLEPATRSPEAVLERIGILTEQLRVTCFCTGSADLDALRAAPARVRGGASSVETATEPSTSGRRAPPRGSASRAAVPMEHVLQGVRARVEARLGEICAGKGMAPETLTRTLDYALMGRSKRIRPTLLYLIAEPGAAGERAAVDLGCAVECIHTASLILDDLPCMDDATLRRGRPATHVAFGEATAVLAAIALLSQGFGLIAELDGVSSETRTRLAAVAASAVGMNGLVAGQQIDLLGRRRAATPEEVERGDWLKTGVLFEAAAVMGGMLRGMEEPDLAALRRFARHFGLAFQAADDLLDQMATTAAAGKDTRRDGGKTTIVSLFGLTRVGSLRDTHLAQASIALHESPVTPGPILHLARQCFPEWQADSL